MFVYSMCKCMLYMFLCVPVLFQLLLELQSEMSYRFVLDEIHKQVRQTHLQIDRETHLLIYTCSHRTHL